MLEIRNALRIVTGYRSYDMTYRQLQREIGEHLAQLRRTIADDLSPEDIAKRAKERHLQIGARTIRDLEKGVGNPSIETLYPLLTYYGTSLGEFFRFTIEGGSGDARLLEDFRLAIKNPTYRKSLSTVIGSLLGKEPE